MKKTYKEFDICLKKKSKDNYLAEVFDEKGKSKAQKPFVLEMGKLKMREDLKHLEELAISSQLVKEDFHINFGKHIFNLVFGDGIKTYYDQCLKKDQPLRIRIRIDESAKELNTIPWEFLHDGENFLVTQSETLISRLPLNVEKKKKGKLDQAISMLVVISSPLNLPAHQVLNTEKEQEVILKALDKLHRERKLDIDFVDDASLDTIQDYLSEKDYHILHFTGHGVFDENQDKGFLLLEDTRGRMENVENERVATILQNHKSLRLVVLSACQSAKASNNTGYPDLSRTLLKKGIPAVLSMQHSILDLTATDFAGKFYRYLASGKPVDAALSDARTALYVGDNRNRVDFATPVIFLNDPDSVNVGDIKVKREKFRLRKRPFHVGEVVSKEKGFVGRGKELKMIKEGFESDRKRAFIIYGFGGIGKSVLATGAALRLEDFFHGVKAIKFTQETKAKNILNDLNGFLNLAGINELNKYIHEEISLENKAEVLIDILKQKRFLIIFDGLEKVLTKEKENKISDPELRKFIQLLLNSVSKNSKFIFTSQNDFDPLNGRLAGQIGKINLPELPFPFMLFLMNNFGELEKLSVEKKLEIYKKIGGHPYALGIFSKHAKTTSVDHLLLDLKPVTKEMQDFTLLNRFYDELTDSTKTLLKRMSVFEEAVPLEALQWMMGDEKEVSPNVGEELKSLKSLGLMVKIDRWKLAGEGEKEEWQTEDVFILHKLVKDFALEKLQEDKTEERNQLLAKAASFYEVYAKTTNNIWDWLMARDYYYQGRRFNEAWVITADAFSYLLRWGYMELCIKLLNESIATLTGHKKEMAIAFHNLGIVYQNLGELKQALKKYKQSLKIEKELRDKEGIGNTLHQLGNLHLFQGNYHEASKKYEESLQIAKELGNKAGIANTLHQLGMIHEQLCNYKMALKNCEQSLKIKKQLKDKSGIAITLHQLGVIHHNQGSYKEAFKKYKQSLKIAEELGDRSGIATTLFQLGNIHFRQSNYKQALKKYEASLEIAEELGDKSGISITIHQLGMIHHEQGNCKEAVKKYEQSLKIAQEIGRKSSVGYTLHQLGLVYQQQGNFKQALKKYEDSLKIAEELGDKRGIGYTLHQLGRIHYFQNNYKQALKKYKESLKIKKELKNKRDICMTLHEMGRIHHNQGNYEEALKKYKESLKIKKELRDKQGIGITLYELGRIHHDQGNYEEALKKYKESLKIKKELRDKQGMIYTLWQLGILYANQGNYPEAQKNYEKALRLSLELNDKSSTTKVLHELGLIHHDQGNYKEAVKKYKESLKIAKELKDKQGIIYTLGQLGIVQADQGNYPEAQINNKEVLRLSIELGDRSSTAEAFYQLGVIHYNQGNYKEAIKKYVQCLKIAEQLKDKGRIASSLHQLGMIDEEQKYFKEAMRKYWIALHILTELASPNAEIAERSVSRLREKIGENEFEKLWKEIEEDSKQ